jgi:hypothetical protein
MGIQKYFKYQFHIFVTLETSDGVLLYAISLKDHFYYYLGKYQNYEYTPFEKATLGMSHSSIIIGVNKLLELLKKEKRARKKITQLEMELINRYKTRVLYNPPKRNFKLSNPFTGLDRLFKYDSTMDIDFTSVFA